MRRHALWLLAPLFLICIAAAPWADTAARIRQQNQQKNDSANATLTAKQTLRRKIGDARFDNVSLADVIDSIRDKTNLNIHVNWKALEQQGIDRTRPVTLRLNNVPLQKLIREILNQTTGSADTAPAFYVDEGVVEITTRQIADAQLITKVYPVGDLLMEVPNFAGPQVQLSSVGQNSGGRSGGGGNTSLFSDNSSTDTTTSEQPKTKDQQADALVSLIKESIHPELWRDNGGTASIRYFNGYLVVTAPRSIHEALGNDD